MKFFLCMLLSLSAVRATAERHDNGWGYPTQVTTPRPWAPTPPAFPRQQFEQQMSQCTFLNESGAAAAPSIPGMGMIFTAKAAANGGFDGSTCTISHTSPGEAETAAHCFKDADATIALTFWNAAGQRLVYYLERSMIELDRAKDVAKIRLPQDLAAAWTTMPISSASGSAQSTGAYVLTFDDMRAGGRCGWMLKAKPFLLSTQSPPNFYDNLSSPVSRDSRVFLYVDPSRRDSITEGNSGGPIVGAPSGGRIPFYGILNERISDPSGRFLFGMGVARSTPSNAPFWR